MSLMLHIHKPEDKILSVEVSGIIDTQQELELVASMLDNHSGLRIGYVVYTHHTKNDVDLIHSVKKGSNVTLYWPAMA